MLYKVISKVIVQRLRPVMSKLICPSQASFIHGHQITDNIVVVQEMLNAFNRSKSKWGMVMWKIDLEKAYDKVN